MPQVLFEDLGHCGYEKAHSVQEKHFNRLISAKKSKEDTSAENDAGVLLFCEHPPVYTIGRNGSEDNLIVDKEQLNVDVHRIGRGGDITFHGPGQFVGYPILDLEKWPMGLAAYVEKLEEVIINTLEDYNIIAGRASDAPGVWLDCGTAQERKICALGIQASRWVTMHGFAFNVNTKQDYFNNIIPCGIPDKSVTSMEKELGQTVDIEKVKSKLREHFQLIFELSE